MKTLKKSEKKSNYSINELIKLHCPQAKKILFYTHIPRSFRSTLIGYLYEICQNYSTILLSEKLDLETQKALQDKTLFPKLEKIIPVRDATSSPINPFRKNRYLCKLAKSTIAKYKPDIVIAGSDLYIVFELYLMRFAKKAGALNICLQPSLVAKKSTASLWADLINSHTKYPSFLPGKIRMLLVKIRKHIGHFFKFYILPISSRQKPFFGKSSFIKHKDHTGKRDSDLQTAFAIPDYNIFKNDGTSIKKLCIIPHPLASESRVIFENIYFNKIKKNSNKKIVTLFMPDTLIGFKKNNLDIIIARERIKKWIDIIKLVNQMLPAWQIYIKPHPSLMNFNDIKTKFESISKKIAVVDPKKAADTYIEISDIIIGLPISVSTVLFSASLQCPQKTIISLDIFKELYGDFYKHYAKKIIYIESWQNFKKILSKINAFSYGDNKHI